MTPTKIGRYLIITELGRGGMATVFQAHDPSFKRDVAIKVLPREFLHDPTFRSRFEREAQTIAALEHPAIVPVYDFGEEEGQPYLVMRYMPGGSLADRLRDGPLETAEIAKVLQRIGAALDRAHSQGMVHRDLKPGNILFDQYSDPHLADFGIVKLTQQTSTFTGAGVIGTPAYMSPEQAKGDANIDGRSDIYALGAILFEMLTGIQPYNADTPMGLAVMHIVEPVPRILKVRPDLPPGCETIITRAMAKEREDRYARASELAETLQQATTEISIDSVSVANAPSSLGLTQEDTPDAPTMASSRELAAPRKWTQSPVLRISGGWATGLLVGGAISGPTAGAGLIAGLIGGVSMALTLRRSISSIQRNQIIAITLGWLIGFSVAFGGFAVGNGLVGLIGVIIGGLVTAITLQRVKVVTQRKQTAIIAVGWAISLIIAIFIAAFSVRIVGEVLAFLIGGAVYGAVGAWIMFRQISRRM